jgi:NAD(P)-dependent dehydrogenase (short-subunit alcohol dehydrogenase family)
VIAGATNRALSLSGRTVVVTGATSGIGRAAAIGLARLGARLVIVGRDTTRLQSVTQEITAVGRSTPTAFQADFTHLDQVRELGEKLRGSYERIDVLASNAGAMFWTRTITADGFEATIQTNHLAGFLLANLLRRQLDGGRLIITSSDSYAQGKLDPGDLNGDRIRYRAGRAYGTSKQANILVAREVARRWPDVLSVSYHPGQVRTRIGRGTVAAPYFRLNPFLRSATKGADTLMWLATAPATDLEPGSYYADRRLRELSGPTAAPEIASRLWDSSIAALGQGIEHSEGTRQ